MGPESGGYAASLGDPHILIFVVVIIVTIIFLRNVSAVELLTLVKVNFAQGAEVDDKRLVELRLQGIDDSGLGYVPV